MTTSIDTNVFLALWNPADAANLLANEMLEAATEKGRLMITVSSMPSFWQDGRLQLSINSLEQQVS